MFLNKSLFLRTSALAMSNNVMSKENIGLYRDDGLRILVKKHFWSQEKGKISHQDI